MMLLTRSFLFFNSCLKLDNRARSMLHNLSLHTPLLAYVKLLSVVRTRGLRHGFLLFHWNSMGLPFTRMNLLMLFVCVMAGLLLIYHPTVSVAKPFLSIMHLAVHTVFFPLSAITTFTISLKTIFRSLPWCSN